MSILTTRQDRAYLAVALLIVVAIGGASLLNSLNDPEINLIGAVAYLSALASSAITLFAVNVATYNRR
jgi:hypothetical protein